MYASNSITVLKPQTYDFTGQPSVLLGQNIIIEGNGATIKDRTTAYHAPFVFNQKTKNVVFKNIRFDLKVKNILEPHGVDIKFINCVIASGSNGIATLKGVKNFVVDGLIDEGQFSGNAFGCFAGASAYAGMYNENLTFTNCKITHGSSGEHILRFHNTKNLLVKNCFLDNSRSPVGKHALNLRDGMDFVIDNVTNNAPIPIGGLEIPGEEHKTLVNVKITNSKLNGWIAVYSGVSGLIIDKCTGVATKGSYMFSFRKPFGQRLQGQGTVTNSQFTYKGGKWLAGKGLVATNTTFNGRQV